MISRPTTILAARPITHCHWSSCSTSSIDGMASRPFPLPIRRSLSMELSSGEVAAKRASSATGEDRISALPDEVLLIILLFLDNAADAARTSVLSRRWRPVWTQLPDLRVPFFPEPVSFCRALRASQLHLRYLKLEGDGATPKLMDIWLPAAARRLCGGSLILVYHAPDPDREETPTTTSGSRRKKMKGWLLMPCFEKAAEIKLDLGFLGVTMPRAGVFAQLTVLVLKRVWFCGPYTLSDVVSSPRCPCLQVLKIRRSHGLSDLVVNSESLLELELIYLDSLWKLTVEAAALKNLVVLNCFVESDHIVATVSAPQLVYLYWRDSLDQRSVVFGPMPHLQFIGQLSYYVYGIQGVPYGGIPDNSACMKLLQPFKAIESLALTLVVMRNLGNYQYMMEDMKVLPSPAILYLSVHANGHSFGASAFHVLRMCLGIKKLELELLDNANAEAQTPCIPGCVCDEQTNWKAEELLLINLQEIDILVFGGSEHEVSFMKRLLDCATALNKITAFLHPSTTESKAKELFQLFESLSRPGVCMELYHNLKKVSYAT